MTSDDDDDNDGALLLKMFAVVFQIFNVIRGEFFCGKIGEKQKKYEFMITRLIYI
jgi:hypothetical protein